MYIILEEDGTTYFSDTEPTGYLSQIAAGMTFTTVIRTSTMEDIPREFVYSNESGDSGEACGCWVKIPRLLDDPAPPAYASPADPNANPFA